MRLTTDLPGGADITTESSDKVKGLNAVFT
jgi:hypothetical protein